MPTAAKFIKARIEVGPLADQQVLVRNLYISMDPYMRGRMNGGKSYVPPFELGKAMDGAAVGDVIESRALEFQVGDAVTSRFSWREYFVAGLRRAVRKPYKVSGLKPGHTLHFCTGG